MESHAVVYGIKPTACMESMHSIVWNHNAVVYGIKPTACMESMLCIVWNHNTVVYGIKLKTKSTSNEVLFIYTALNDFKTRTKVVIIPASLIIGSIIIRIK